MNAVIFPVRPGKLAPHKHRVCVGHCPVPSGLSYFFGRAKGGDRELLSLGLSHLRWRL